MADVTGEQLEDALRRVPIVIGSSFPTVNGTQVMARWPGSLASDLLDAIADKSREFGAPVPDGGGPVHPLDAAVGEAVSDPELLTWIRICQDADGLKQAYGQRGMVRLLDYLNSRYGSAPYATP